MFNKYDKSKTYLVAVSGGPDSMALLNMLVLEHFSILVAHVNYKTRNESDLEEDLVRKYCNENQIPCYIATYIDVNSKSSFEVKARNFRYSFFKEVYDHNQCSGVFVAHHKDDLIETYLLKKQRNVINESYLINEFSKVKGMLIIRPFLQQYYKSDLLIYCKKYNVPYNIDYTNFLPIHPRNIIRAQLEYENKEEFYLKALEEERKLKEIQNNVKDFIAYYPIYSTSLLKEKDFCFLAIFLHEIIDKKWKRKVTKSLVLKLQDFLKSTKANLKYLIGDQYYLLKEYNQISFRYLQQGDYEYHYEKLEYVKTPQFKLVKEGLKMQGIYVSSDDFPIIIRNVHEEDRIQLKSGTKKVSRLFIDKKIPLEQRKNWLIIENCKQEIIFVYKLYRKYGLKYTKNNLFVIK